jgi:transposase InsO family protein
VSRSTISRHLTAAGLVIPEPKKRPKSSYVRFEASMPNETWQSEFTHYRLTRPDGRPGVDVEIIIWLDDCTRYALHVSAHARVTTPIVVTTFREALARHGIPASTLTDNGMVYTVRLAGHGRQGGKNSFEAELNRRHIVQKNSRPGHPTTCGKAERFQQTLKKWLRAQPEQPTTIAELQTLLDRFADEYNHRLEPAPTAPIPAPPGSPGHALRLDAQGTTGPGHPRRTSGSATTASTSPARSRCGTTADSTTSASAEPTPEPASS